MSEKKRGKIFDMRHTDPRVPFFVAFAATNLDGTIDSGEIPEGFFPSADDALQCLKDNAEEYGMEGYVFECRPISHMKVTRSVRVRPVAKVSGKK